jgi:hypothetical protein
MYSEYSTTMYYQTLDSEHLFVVGVQYSPSVQCNVGM